MSRANPRFHRVNPALPAPTGNVLFLTVFGTVEGQIVLNTLAYMDSGGTPTTGTLAGFMTGWDNVNRVKLLACSSAEYTITQLKAQYLNLPAIAPQYDVLTGSVVGTGGSGHEPTTVACVFTKYSGVKGQSGRGRYYVPAVPTQGVNAGLSTITTAYTTTVNTFATSLGTAITVGAFTYNHTIFSRRLYNKVTGVGGGASLVLSTGYIVRTTLATVRRRRLGRGK